MDSEFTTNVGIPITKEFLVKNGFHVQDNYYTIADLSKGNGFWSIKVIFSQDHPTHIRRIEIENVVDKDVININMSTIGGKIYYVHELQHAIILSGIGKKIVL